jgi:CRISPR-associated protein Csb1
VDQNELSRTVAEDAAIRRRRRLQPVGGPGDRIFPPTYPGEGREPPRHVVERRRIQGQDVWCALVDSVQSQANRLEEALLLAIRDGAVSLPHLVVDFRPAQLAGIVEITSLDAPHRVYDAILRDSLLDGEPFPNSALGVRLAQASPGDAGALLEVCPTALLFGAWNSTGTGGGLGAKFPRALVSEIAAIGVSVEEVAIVESRNPRSEDERIEARNAGRRTGSRIDPLGILRKVEVFQGENKQWEADPAKAGKKWKKVRPSEINHGNIRPDVQALGITCDYVDHTAVISFAGLRRLSFGGGAKDAAGRAYLAALGLLALAEQDARGYALRSRCDLVCEEARAPLQRVAADGTTIEIDLDRAAARALFEAARAAALQAGLALAEQPVRLVPQQKLVEIVRESQRLALAGEGGAADEGDA